MNMARKNETAEMNIIYKRGVSEDYSKESLGGMSPLMASGGDAHGGILACKLCGASEHLHLITNDRADEMLKSHFGVKVSPTSFICGSCKNYLRITIGFSALVRASLKSCVSSISIKSSRTKILDYTHLKHTKLLQDSTPGVDNTAVNPNKEILSLLQSQMTAKKRVRRSLPKNIPSVIRKKIITNCTVCGQRYPVMVLPNNSAQPFVCSRCQKYSENVERRNNPAQEGSKRCFLKGRTRLECLPKISQQVKPSTNSSKATPRNINRQFAKQNAILDVSNIKQIRKGISSIAWSDKRMVAPNKTASEKHTEQRTDKLLCEMPKNRHFRSKRTEHRINTTNVSVKDRQCSQLHKQKLWL